MEKLDQSLTAATAQPTQDLIDNLVVPLRIAEYLEFMAYIRWPSYMLHGSRIFKTPFNWSFFWTWFQQFPGVARALAFKADFVRARQLLFDYRTAWNKASDFEFDIYYNKISDRQAVMLREQFQSVRWHALAVARNARDMQWELLLRSGGSVSDAECLLFYILKHDIAQCAREWGKSKSSITEKCSELPDYLERLELRLFQLSTDLGMCVLEAIRRGVPVGDDTKLLAGTLGHAPSQFYMTLAQNQLGLPDAIPSREALFRFREQLIVDGSALVAKRLFPEDIQWPERKRLPQFGASTPVADREMLTSLDVHESRILEALAATGKTVLIVDLAAAVDLSAKTTGQKTRSLVKMGLVRRKGRKSGVEITDEGRGRTGKIEED